MAKMSAYKAHETRMWLSNVIIPVVGLIGYGVITLTQEDTRERVKDLCISTKDKIHDKVARTWYKLTK